MSVVRSVATGGCGHCLSSPLRATAPLSGCPQGSRSVPSSVRDRRLWPLFDPRVPRPVRAGPSVGLAPVRVVVVVVSRRRRCEDSCTSSCRCRSIVVRPRQEAVATVNPRGFTFRARWPLREAGPGHVFVVLRRRRGEAFGSKGSARHNGTGLAGTRRADQAAASPHSALSRQATSGRRAASQGLVLQRGMTTNVIKPQRRHQRMRDMVRYAGERVAAAWRDNESHQSQRHHYRQLDEPAEGGTRRCRARTTAGVATSFVSSSATISACETDRPAVGAALRCLAWCRSVA